MKLQEFGQIIKLKELLMLIQIFVIHGDEIRGDRKQYFDKLSEEEKINKLDEIYLIILILKYQMRKK